MEIKMKLERLKFRSDFGSSASEVDFARIEDGEVPIEQRRPRLQYVHPAYKAKGLILRFLEKTRGYSHHQLSRLVGASLKGKVLKMIRHGRRSGLFPLSFLDAFDEIDGFAIDHLFDKAVNIRLKS